MHVPPTDWIKTYAVEKWATREAIKTSVEALFERLLNEVFGPVAADIDADEVLKATSIILDDISNPGRTWPPPSPSHVRQVRRILEDYAANAGVVFRGIVFPTTIDDDYAGSLPALGIPFDWPLFQERCEAVLGPLPPISLLVKCSAPSHSLFDVSTVGLVELDLRDLRSIKRSFDAYWVDTSSWLTLRMTF